MLHSTVTSRDSEDICTDSKRGGDLEPVWQDSIEQLTRCEDVKTNTLFEDLLIIAGPAPHLQPQELKIIPLRDTTWAVVQRVSAWEANAFGGRTVDQREKQYWSAFSALNAGRDDPSAWGILESFVAMDLQSGDCYGSVSLVSNDLAWWKSDLGFRPWISSLYVPGNARRQGLGSRLLEHAIAEAARRGFPHLFLYCCPDRAQLNKWYESRGFQSCCDRLHGGLRIMCRPVHL